MRCIYTRLYFFVRQVGDIPSSKVHETRSPRALDISVLHPAHVSGSKNTLATLETDENHSSPQLFARAPVASRNCCPS